MKQNTKRLFLRLIAINLFLSMFIGTVRAEPVITSNAPLVEDALIVEEGSENAVAPCDISFNEGVWTTLNSQSVVYHAPYATGNAPSQYTLPAGHGVFVCGRAYEYYYVYWYINGKEMYGYIPISKLTVTNWIWIQYDLYQMGHCTGETTVLSGPGTTNTYIAYGTIYANEAPLLILGKVVNQFNSKTYYYIQYETDNGLAKRGWVDSSLGTVSVLVRQQSSLINESNPFAFINQETQTALTWDETTNTVKHQPFYGALSQLFLLDIQQHSSIANSYYAKIIPLADETKALRIASTGYADGLTLIASDRNGIDKRQEFCIAPTVSSVINIDPDTQVKTMVCNVELFSRSTGYYRSLSAHDNSIVKQTAPPTDNSVEFNKLWELVCVYAEWPETFGQYGGSKKPNDFYVYYDNSVYTYFHSYLQTQPISRWNTVYDDLSLTVSSAYNINDTNCLAKITDESLDYLEDDDIIGKCLPIQRSGSSWVTATDNEMNFLRWHSTKIVLDLEQLENYSFQSGDIMNVLIHELGHSLKLSHAYANFKWVESVATGDWDPISLSSSPMNPGISATPSGQSVISILPGALEGWRLARKWDSIS